MAFNNIKDLFVAVDGQWSEWSKWDICDGPSCSSEVGQQTRYRRCTNPRPMFGGKKCHGSSIGTKSCYNNEYCSEPGINASQLI